MQLRWQKSSHSRGETKCCLEYGREWWTLICTKGHWTFVNCKGCSIPFVWYIKNDVNPFILGTLAFHCVIYCRDSLLVQVKNISQYHYRLIPSKWLLGNSWAEQDSIHVTFRYLCFGLFSAWLNAGNSHRNVAILSLK